MTRLDVPGGRRECALAVKSAAQETRTLGQAATTLDGLAEVAARFLPAELFDPEGGQRERLFPPWVTFIAFLSQVLTRGASCREALRAAQAWALASGRPVPDENTSAYCQARARLSLETLAAAHEQLGEWFAANGPDNWCGRAVKVIDGTGVSMPDTADNRARWSYAPNQKPGCGFPTAKLVGLFSVMTGRLERFALGTQHDHELSLARQMIGSLQTGAVVLLDRGFCGWGFFALLQRKGVDVVARLHSQRPPTPGVGPWPKPPRGQNGWNKTLWDELPASLTVRVIRFRTAVPGFRSQEIVLATTLLDEEAYPDEAIVALYRRRWAVELCFRDIKTTLGLDVVRCQSPEMVEREIWMQAFGYNLVRALMLEAARAYAAPLESLSFKGTVDALRQWTPLLAPKLFVAPAAQHELLRTIAADGLPDRPNRHEPRARKRRPKPYPLLTEPRSRARKRML
jgi:hypothetical protein